MDLVTRTESWQRTILLALPVVTALVFWTGMPDAVGLPKVTVVWLAAISLAALSTIRLAATRTILVPRSPLTAALGFFVVGLLVATAVSDTPMLSLIGEYTRYSGLASYLAYVVVAVVGLRILERDDIERLLELITVTLGIVLLYGILQLVDIDPIDWKDSGFQPVFSTLGNSNFLAGFIGMTVPAAAYVALRPGGPTWVRGGACGIVLAALVVAIGTESFQGPVTVVAGLGFLAAVLLTGRDSTAPERADRRPRLLFAVAAAGVTIAVAAVVAVPDGVRDGFIERGSFYRAALSMFRDSPVVGLGLDTYGQEFLRYRPASHAANFYSHAEAAHDVLLNLLAGGGVLLALGWLALVASVGFRLVVGLRRLPGPERLLLGAVGACWFAYVVQSLVSIDVPTLALLHFLLAAAVIVVADGPPFRSVALPGAPVAPAGRKGRSGRLVQAPGATSIQVVVVVLGLVGAWLALRPIRADLAAAGAIDASNRGDDPTALASAASATNLAPWQGRHWLIRAQVSERAQEVFAAVDAAAEAAIREPGSAEYALLAGRLADRYRPEDAEPWFDAALERDPENPVTFAAVARYEAEHDQERARELAEEATERAPDQVFGWVALGVVHEAAGDADAARAAYERALEIDPQHTESLLAIARLEEADGGPGD